MFFKKRKSLSDQKEIQKHYELVRLRGLIIDLQFELSRLHLNQSQANVLLFTVSHIIKVMEALEISQIDLNADKCQKIVIVDKVLSIKRESEEI